MSTIDMFSLKELYDVVLKSTYPIEINGIYFEAGEVIAKFDKIDVFDFKEDKQFITAHGGFQDRDRVWWETTKDIRVSFSQGVFSKTQYAILNNSRLLRKTNDQVSISKREELISDDDGIINLSFVPNNDKIFVYSENTGLKCNIDHSLIDTRRIQVLDAELRPVPQEQVYVDYTYNYNEEYSVMTISQALYNGFLTLEGKTRCKDDVTGQNITALIKIPKLKLTSQLSLRLGQGATPVCGHFNGVACVSGTRERPVALELIYLSDDIDADF